MIIKPFAYAVLGLALTLSGCATTDGAATTSRDSRATTTVPPSTTAPPQLAPPLPYQPLPGEPVPEMKQAAAQVVQALATYAVGGGTQAEAAARVAALGAPATVAQAAAPLLVPSASSAADIVYPQLAGLTPTQGAVMVVVRQRLLEGRSERAVVRTLDVRLALLGSRWQVTELASAGGEPPANPVPPSPAAQQVLENDRIRLADSARWDIRAGRVDQRVLDVLLRLAKVYVVDVTVLASGHPFTVFARPNVSNHTVGRAVDIWALDGKPVIQQRAPGSSLDLLSRQLLQEGVTELGSPWDLDGRGLAAFTDTVHQDHLHLGFRA